MYKGFITSNTIEGFKNRLGYSFNSMQDCLDWINCHKQKFGADNLNYWFEYKGL